ncbi:MAG: zinc ribbon domain-containing protein [Firmicutes bacterium]|nr:zinc ribbon domain-containing protein [Bacillota bacterium]
MPTYTFECEKCGTFDVKLTVDDRNLETCPNCQGKVSRVFKPSRNFYSFRGNWFAEKRTNRKIMDMDDLEDPNFDWTKVNHDDLVESYKEKRWGTRNPDPEMVIDDLTKGDQSGKA